MGILSSSLAEQSTCGGEMRREENPFLEWVYEFIVNFQRGHGYSPTYQEIADGAGCGKSKVFYYVKELEKQKRITILNKGVRFIAVDK
jgi:hypothetical protein